MLMCLRLKMKIGLRKHMHVKNSTQSKLQIQIHKKLLSHLVHPNQQSSQGSYKARRISEVTKHKTMQLGTMHHIRELIRR